MDLAGYRPTLGEVAALFGKSSRWISDLRAKGEMPGDGATLAEFVAALTSYSAGGGAGIKGKPIDLAKARSATARAERDEMETAALKRELLPRGEVTRAVQTAFARVRGKLLGLGSKLAPRLVSMKTVVAIEDAITEHVHEALAELSATFVGIEEASDRRSSGDAPGGEPGDRGSGTDVVADPDAAPAVDGEPVGGPVPGAKPGRKRRAR